MRKITHLCIFYTLREQFADYMRNNGINENAILINRGAVIMKRKYWIMNNDSKKIYFTSGDGKLTVEALRLDLHRIWRKHYGKYTLIINALILVTICCRR